MAPALYKIKDKLESHLCDTTDNMFNLTNIIAIFDLTNFYFEGRKDMSKKAQFGRSKEKRSDCKLLEDTVVSEKIGFRKHLPVDRFISKAEMLRFLTMGGCNICKFPESSAANQLAEHQNQHMAPMRKRPSFGPVVVLGEDSPEMSLREKHGYLCKNVLPNMHICSDFESDAKVCISKPGQGVGRLKHCA